MATLYRYPSKAYDEGAPFIKFSQQRPVYESLSSTPADSDGSVPTAVSRARSLQPERLLNEFVGQTVAMYMPINFQIGDSMSYDTVETGIIGALTEGVSEGGVDNLIQTVTNPDGNDLTAVAQSVAPGVAGAAVAGLARFRGIGGLLGLAGGAGAASSVTNELRKSSQVAINPRQFILFKSPNMRSFNLNFRFIPESSKESDDVQNIIDFFRTGMYPELTGSGITYVFPNSFQISFENIGGIPRIPETVLTSANTTFNPNSMSYFKQNKRPVEINLDLTFQELQPMHKLKVVQGF